MPRTFPWRKDNALKVAVSRALRSARIKSEAKGIVFDLPKGTTAKLVEECGGVCAMSGLPFRFGGVSGSTYSPSIDRIEPEKGYVAGNVRVILHGINALKSSGTDEDVFAVCKAVLEKNR